MTARELMLNIAVNLGRVGRWSCEGRVNRLQQFLDETEGYIRELETKPKSLSIQKTFNVFKEEFFVLRHAERFDAVWAEMMFTWANILTHRAKSA